MKRIIFCMLCLVMGYTAVFAQSNKNNNTGPAYAALPVKESYIPDDIVSKVVQQYGSNLYSITALKGKNGAIEYWIRLKENNMMKEEWVNENAVVLR